MCERLLDEPTNHLSAEGCDWLQELVLRYSWENMEGTQVVLLASRCEWRHFVSMHLIDPCKLRILYARVHRHEMSNGLKERLKKASDLSVVLVTHDRYFLDEAMPRACHSQSLSNIV